MDTGTDAAMDPQGGMSITGPDKLELDEWYHIAATYTIKTKEGSCT